MVGEEFIEFSGPRGRYYRAQYEIKNPDSDESNDVWVIKLKQLLKQRAQYDDVRYMAEQPFFHKLFSIFENDSAKSPKYMLEAMLVTGEDFDVIAKKLGDPVITDGLVVGLYHELFYNIRPYIGSVPMMYRYVVQPLLHCNGVRIPLGEIWKLLGYCGGMDVLEASGFGTRPLSPEDMVYLLQLSGYRNVAMMLKYIADGDEFVRDNPTAANLVMGLSELNRQVGGEKTVDQFGFKKLENTQGTDYAHALTGFFKMVYDTEVITEASNNIEDKLITCTPTKIETE